MAVESIIKRVGSSVLEFQPSGSRFVWSVKDVPILGSFTRGDGAEGISHSAVPVFDRDPWGKLKRHGLVRDRDLIAKIVVETMNSITTREVLTYGDPESALLLLQTYTVHQDDWDKAQTAFFELVSDLRNIGNAAIPELSGLHPYFSAPEGRANVLFNGQNITELMEEDGLAKTQESNTLFIPGAGELCLRQYGFPVANAWVGENGDGQFDNEYFALSFVSDDFRNPDSSFRSTKRVLMPGESRHTRLTVSSKVFS